MTSLKVKKGDLIFFGAGREKTVNDYMSRLIAKIGDDLDLLKGDFAACIHPQYDTVRAFNEFAVFFLAFLNLFERAGINNPNG